MKIILRDDPAKYSQMLPLCYTRPMGMQRLGIDTIAEKWRDMTGCPVGFACAGYLQGKFGSVPDTAPGQVFVDSSLVPDEALVAAVTSLKPGQRLMHDDIEIASDGSWPADDVEFAADITVLNRPYDIFLLNDREIRADFERLTHGRERRPVSSSVTLIGNPDNLFIHPEAGNVEGCIINVATGPVYIGPGAQVMEGACLRGPIAVCNDAVVKMGAKIYGATTIGPCCKVGGEIENVVMQGYSNKAHDGFLGNAVIGEWCNLGAGCVASNLKNDYSSIRLWNYATRRFERTELQFCGLIMGDHSKTGVNTMLNTATVLGVGVSIHGSGFPRPFVASFQEGSTHGFTDVPMQKFLDTARKVMARRGLELTQDDIDILTYIRNYSESLR